MYQVGRADYPAHNDPHYDTEAEALEAAQKAATGDLVYAVWKQIGDDEFDTLYLIYQGDVWRRA